MRHLRWVFVLSLSAIPASAGLLQSFTNVTFGGSTYCANSNFSGTASLSTCGTGASTGVSQALAGYGALKAYASFTALNEPLSSVSVTSTAFFLDNLIFTPTGPAPASIDFHFTVTGAGMSGSNASVSLNVSAPGTSPLVATSGVGTFTLTAPYDPFNLGGPSYNLALTGTLTAKAEFDNGAGGWSGSATSDFYSTATLSSIVVYDSLLNDISNTVNLSGGAASYPLGGGSEVPEPSTLLLTAGAAAAVAIVRKRARA
jgi:hypothetical protein